MKTATIVALVMGIILISSSSFAQTRTDKRQHAQRARIHDGRKDGEVTRREAALLNREQKRIQNCEQMAKADGHVTRREKVRLEHRQDMANRNIHRATNNSIDKK